MQKNYIWQILRWFIMFILIPVLLLNLAIGFLFYNIKRSMDLGVISQLEHARILLNETLDEIAVEVQRLGQQPVISKSAQMNKGFGVDGYRNLIAVRDYCEDYGIGNKEQYSVGLLFNKNDAYVTNNTIYIDLSRSYAQGLFSFGDVPYEELKQIGFQITGVHYPAAEFSLGDEKGCSILYATVLSQYTSKDSDVTALVNIWETGLKNIFSSFLNQGAMVYIGDVNGQILIQMGDRNIQAQSISEIELYDEVKVLDASHYGKDAYALRVQLHSGLYACVVIPKQRLYLGTNSLTLFVVMLNITTILMCLFLVFKAAVGTKRKMKNVWDMLPEKNDKGENFFALIDNVVGGLKETNRKLESQLGEQQQYMKTVFWDKMLNVNTLSDAEVNILAGRAGIRLNASAYCLIFISLDYSGGLEEEDWQVDAQSRERLHEILGQQARNCGYISYSSFSQMVILAGFNEEECECYRQTIEKNLSVISELTSQNEELLCVGSRLFAHISELYLVYGACRNHLGMYSRDYKEARHIGWCEENEINAEDTFYYTDEMKQQITVWIKSGRKEETKSGLKNILEENYLKRSINPEMEKLLMAKFKLTLASAYDKQMEFDLQKELDIIDTIKEDAVLFSHICRVALNMCEFYRQNIQKHEEGLRKKSRDYIEEHFREYEFSMSAVAEHCHLSKSYFSQIFKEIMGEKFSDYLEKKRMDYARGLLENTNWTVERIGIETGYSNTNAFRKAYKRYYGVSPAQGRKKV